DGRAAAGAARAPARVRHANPDPALGRGSHPARRGAALLGGHHAPGRPAACRPRRRAVARRGVLVRRQRRNGQAPEPGGRRPGDPPPGRPGGSRHRRRGVRTGPPGRRHRRPAGASVKAEVRVRAAGRGLREGGLAPAASKGDGLELLSRRRDPVPLPRPYRRRL
ncbi:MAG: hypothetical protein AVDCRST_MAG10-1410, partial [uncultured Acidimicrobiales bacterium]